MHEQQGRRLAVLGCLLLAGCRAVENPRTFLDAMISISREWKPKVARIMGTSQDVSIVIDEENTMLDSSTRAGTSADRQHVIYGPELQSLPLLAWHYASAHEMVHVHAGDYWTTLPLFLEEGLAHTIALTLLPGAREEVEDDMRDSDRRGYEIVARLGVGGVRDLAKRAQREGLDEIPEEWLE